MESNRGTLSVTVNFDEGIAEFSYQHPNYGEPYEIRIERFTAEDHSDQFAAGLRFILDDDSDADPTYFATLKDAISYAWRTILEDIMQRE